MKKAARLQIIVDELIIDPILDSNTKIEMMENWLVAHELRFGNVIMDVEMAESYNGVICILQEGIKRLKEVQMGN